MPIPDTTLPSLLGEPLLFLHFTSLLTNTGGTRDIVAIVENICLDTACLQTDVARAEFTGTVSAIPIPASVWLFGSGLLGLIGIARRKA